MKIKHDEDTVQNIVKLVVEKLRLPFFANSEIKTGLELYAEKFAEPLLERIAELEEELEKEQIDASELDKELFYQHDAALIKYEDRIAELEDALAEKQVELNQIRSENNSLVSRLLDFKEGEPP